MTGPQPDLVLSTQVRGELAELAAMDLWDRGATAVQLIEEGPDVNLIASFPTNQATIEVAAELGASITEVDGGWADAWRAFAEPVDAGGVVIAPAWRDIPLPGLVVRIDPGRVFGSGSHASSRLLLRWLAGHPPLGLRVADVGAGSGVLAVTAAVLGAESVDAVDIDPASAGIVAANAEANGVGRIVSARTGSAADLPRLVDLALVNVTAAVQVELAADVRRAVVGGGRILLAGLLPGQWRHVAPSYEGCRTELLPELDGWVGAVVTV